MLCRMRHTARHQGYDRHAADRAPIRSWALAVVCNPKQPTAPRHGRKLLIVSLHRSHLALPGRTLRGISITCSGTDSSALQPPDGSDSVADGSGGISAALDRAIVHWDATSSRLVDSATLPFVFLLLPQVQAQHLQSMVYSVPFQKPCREINDPGSLSDSKFPDRWC